MAQTPDEVIAYYQNLLIIQYKRLPKAFQTIGALSEQVTANLIYNAVLNAFDLNTAIGEQIDILGAYVGARRFLANFSSTNTFMAFPFYADAGAGSVVGFAQYTDANPPVGYWRLYTTVDTSLVLTDGQMRDLAKYLIAVHASDMSNASIDDIMYRFFGQYVTVDDGYDMSMTYTHDATNDPFQLFAIVEYMNALPRPAGVTVNVINV